MLFSICTKGFFGDQHIDMTLKENHLGYGQLTIAILMMLSLGAAFLRRDFQRVWNMSAITFAALIYQVPLKFWFKVFVLKPSPKTTGWASSKPTPRWCRSSTDLNGVSV
jgi:hypothetical protein